MKLHFAKISANKPNLFRKLYRLYRFCGENNENNYAESNIIQ